jgi:hypothetical protein|tara:strand:- start:1115 stop:1393 length:279 start_codon:yes stop_codon:yes gene_type:complete
MMDLIVGNVEVKTTDNRGLSAEELSYLCVDKIVSISKDAPDPIRLQAEAFKERTRKVVLYYMEQVKKSDRTTVCNAIKDSGQSQLSEYVRRL